MAPSLSNYQPLGTFLSSCPENEIICTFADLEQMLGQPLPPTARTWAWWTGHTHSRQSETWTAAGWALKKVEPRRRRVIFARQPDQGPGGGTARPAG